MLKDIKDFLDKMIDKLYPKDVTCFLCGEELKDNKTVCEQCDKDIKWNEHACLKCGSPCSSIADYCINCKGRKRHFNFARAPLIYSDEIAFSVQSFKYDGKKYLAYPFAKLLKKELDKIVEAGINIDSITYVPLFKSRQKKRGYNQSELLAKELSKLTKIPLISENLIRIKDTITQTNLTYKERQKNLDGAFEIKNPLDFKNKNIILIDDVLTTGSTTEHCAKILKEAKAKNVYVLTVATTESKVI